MNDMPTGSSEAKTLGHKSRPGSTAAAHGATCPQKPLPLGSSNGGKPTRPTGLALADPDGSRQPGGADSQAADRVHPKNKKRRPRETSHQASARSREEPRPQTNTTRNPQDTAVETERRQTNRAAELRSLFLDMSRAANSHWTKGNSKIDIFYAEGQVSDRTGCYVSTFLSLAGGQPNQLSLTAIVARNVKTPTNSFLLHINAVNSNAKRARALFDPEFRQVVLISEADCYRKEDLTSAVSALFRRFSRLLNDPYLAVALAEGRATYTGKANLEEIPGPLGPVQNQE